MGIINIGRKYKDAFNIKINATEYNKHGVMDDAIRGCCCIWVLRFVRIYILFGIF